MKRKKKILSSNFAGINIHGVYLLQNVLYIYAFVCCADSFLLASSFSPRRCDLHAKVRAEILIGRAALYKSTYTPAGARKTEKKERETCEIERMRKKDR